MVKLQDDATDFDEFVYTGKTVDVNKFADELFAITGLKFKATNPNDTVHGSITQIGDEVIIHVYTTDKNPTTKRKSTLKKPTIMPTSAQFSTAIEAHQP